MKNQVVILAGGKGKRMNNGQFPKVLADLGGRPLITHLLAEVEKLKPVLKPVIVVGFRSDMVQEALGENYSYALQERQLGTAHAVLSAKDKIEGDNILVLYGDMPFIKANSLAELACLHLKTQSPISMFTSQVPGFEGEFSSLEKFGRILRNEQGKIAKIQEYKDAIEQERKILEVNPGIYMFNSRWLWDNIEKIQNQNVQGEYYLTDIVEIAIGQGFAVEAASIPPEQVMGVNTQEELVLSANKLKTS